MFEPRLRAERELAIEWPYDHVNSLFRIIVAGYADGYDSGFQAACDWLRMKEYTSEAEALEAEFKAAKDQPT